MTLPTLDDLAAPTSLRVVSVPLTELHSDPTNVRLHPERNLRAIEDSLREFGQVEPLLVQEGTGKVVGGNGRLEVMRKLGWRTATVTMLPLSKAQASGLAIALNRTGELAEWDKEGLSAVISSLESSFDPQLLGFDASELDRLLRTATVDLSACAEPQAGERTKSAPVEGPLPEPEREPAPAGAEAAAGPRQMVQLSLLRSDAEEFFSLVGQAEALFETKTLGETVLAALRAAAG